MVYGLPYSQMGVSTKILSPFRSSTSIFSTTPLIKIKIEPSVDNVIHLTNSLNEDVPVQKVVVHDSTPLFHYASYVSPFLLALCLKLLRYHLYPNLPKKIYYNKIKIQEVNHLPPCFDGIQLFVQPATQVSSSQTRAKLLDGMDRRYDGDMMDKDSNHQHYKRRWCCSLFFYLYWPSPMPKLKL